MSLGTLATACDDGGDEAMDLTVETFNVGLAGAFVPAEQARRQPLSEAIAASDADVLCLQEVWTQSDKDMIIEAAAANFPYAVAFEHDLDTEVDDPSDQNGDIPPVATTPPCGAEALQTSLDNALTCLVENCNTDPGSEDGQATSTDCAQASCIGQVAALLVGNAESLRCYGCLAVNLPTENFGEIRNLCTAEINADLAFRGQSGVAILSRYPLSNARDIVLPGTWNRRVIAVATVELPNSAQVDVYCNHLTPIFDSTAFPYTGPYGEGSVNDLGWANEQTLQARKLAAHVEAETGEGRAIIMGDFNASRAANGLVAEGEATLDVLEGALTPAVVAGFTPVCTYCAENPITGSSDSLWIDHIFLFNIDASAVVSTERTYTENSVPFEGGSVPLSDHYGLRSVVTIQP